MYDEFESSCRSWVFAETKWRKNPVKKSLTVSGWKWSVRHSPLKHSKVAAMMVFGQVIGVTQLLVYQPVSRVKEVSTPIFWHIVDKGWGDPSSSPFGEELSRLARGLLPTLADRRNHHG